MASKRSSSAPTAPNLVGRPAVKRQQIVRHLHDQIVAGRLGPGSRLPTRRQLQSRFRTSLSTVQQALDQLSDEGFIEPRGKAGTFVCDQPPHMARYGVVVPNQPHAHHFPRFWSALVNEALRIGGQTGRSMRIYHGIADREQAPDYARLLHDVRRHCLAGLIFVSNPFYLEAAGLLESADVPCVAVGGASGMSMQMPAASLDTDSFFIKAVEHLVQRGRRRIAMIAPPDVAHVNMFKPLAKAMAGFGLSPCPYLMQESPSQSTSAARNLAHLLMRLPAGERPDGLIIADDNLVEHASAGIVDAMVRVPEELEMVAHCNFPWPTPSVVKARRLGYDAGEVIATCLRCLDQQRARPRQRVADPKPIPARFEDELTPVAAPVTPML